LKLLDKILSKDKVVDVDVDSLVVESRNRLDNIAPNIKKIVSIIAIAWSVFQIYTGLFGLLPALLQRSVTLGFGLVLGFVCFQFTRKDKNKLPIYDYILIILSICTALYLWVSFDSLVVRGGSPSGMDVVMGVILIVLVLEGTRRTVGLPLVIVGGRWSSGKRN